MVKGMREYGRLKTVRFQGKTDCHPKKLGKGWMNWWEDIAKVFTRSRMKQIQKKEIEKLLKEEK